MVDRVLALPERTRLYLLAPVVRGRKGEYRKEIAEFMKRGFQRLKIDGQFYDIADAPALDKKLKHDIDVVVDRIVVRADISARLAESFETALELADGIAIVEFADEPAEGEAPERDRLFLEIRLPGVGLHHPGNRAAAVLLQQSLRRLPEMRRHRLRAEGRSRPDRAQSRADAAQRRRSRPGRNRPRPIMRRRWKRWARHFKFRMDDRWSKLPEDAQDVILYGSGERGDPLRL